MFIDPVATGFSRPAEEGKAEQFFGESPDIESVGEFIRLWTTRHERWLSPKYVCGESYGVFRAAGLAHHLHSRYGMSLSGLIFVSGLLDFASLSGDLACQVFLPAYTAAAHFHKKLPPDLQADLPKALAEAREFMRTEYAAALFQGASLTAQQRARVVAKLSRLTGLAGPGRSKTTICASTLRRSARSCCATGDWFSVVSTPASPAATPPRRRAIRDLTLRLSAIDGAFAAAMNAYVRGELKFEDDLPYWDTQRG